MLAAGHHKNHKNHKNQSSDNLKYIRSKCNTCFLRFFSYLCMLIFYKISEI
jgi:hypothetical protein